MKIQYLQYALEIAECGSINKAADKLQLSQPNISSILKTLENELEFPVFSRTSQGVAVTPEGQHFLSCARRIIQEYEQISAIKTGGTTRRFHLSAGHHSAIEEAFSLLCAEFQDNGRMDFSIRNTDPDSIIEDVYHNRSDLGILLLPRDNSDAVLSLCAKKGLVVTALRELCFNIHLRRDHPLLQDKSLNMNQLQDYPFVDYSNNVLSSSPDLNRLGIINPDKKIVVDERDTRCHIVASTDAFSIGCSLHPRIRDSYHWVCIPLPDISYRMISVHRRNFGLTPEAKRYLQLLKQETEDI